MSTIVFGQWVREWDSEHRAVRIRLMSTIVFGQWVREWDSEHRAVRIRIDVDDRFRPMGARMGF